MSVISEFLGNALIAMGCTRITPSKEGNEPEFIIADSGQPGDFKTEPELINGWLLFGQGKRKASVLPAKARR